MYFIEVECPHCGVRGRLLLPPPAAIIIGPCPGCRELVMVFSGYVWALNSKIMTTGSVKQQRHHLKSRLKAWLEERINKITEEPFSADILRQLCEYSPAADDWYNGREKQRGEQGDSEPGLEFRPAAARGLGPITPKEIQEFQKCLSLLDNRDYFHKIFGDLDD